MFGGTWEVKWCDNSTTKYQMRAGKVVVLSCFFDCKSIMEASLQPSESQRYPSSDGWMKIDPIHRVDIFLYLQVSKDRSSLKGYYYSKYFEYPDDSCSLVGIREGKYF